MRILIVIINKKYKQITVKITVNKYKYAIIANSLDHLLDLPLG